MGSQRRFGGYISIQKGIVFSAQKIVLLSKTSGYRTPSSVMLRELSQKEG